MTLSETTSSGTTAAPGDRRGVDGSGDPGGRNDPGGRSDPGGRGDRIDSGDRTGPSGDRTDVGAERAAKRARVLGILEATGHDAVVLRSPAALGWYLEGARVNVSPVGDPVLAVRVGRDGDSVHAFGNEAPRLLEEELPAGLTLVEHAWHGALGPLDGVEEAALAAPLRAARASLLPLELDRYRRLCADAARVLTEVCADARPHRTERELAGEASGRLAAGGIEPLVVLVAGAERARHRHPLPTGARVGDRVMVTVSARRHGLFANLTRWVEFAPPPVELRRRTAALARVEADAFAATREGTTLADALAAIAGSYARHGFAADEWTRHHQGGPTGYAGRDPRATPDATDAIASPQAFAWNPTASRVKIEDTVVSTPLGVEVMTVDPAWPTTRVHDLDRPSALTP